MIDQIMSIRRFQLKNFASLQGSSLYTNSFYLIAANVVNAAFGFIFWTVAARLYPPHSVGLAAATVSAIGLIGMLSVLGLDFAMVKFLPRAADPQGIINSSLTIGAIAALALSLLFIARLDIWLPPLLPLRENLLFVVSVVISAVFATVTILLAAVFLSRKRADFVLAQSSVFSMTKVVFALILVALPSAIGLISAWAMGLVAAMVCAAVLFMPRVAEWHYQLRLMVKPEAVNDMMHFAFTNYVAAVLWSGPVFLLPLLVVNFAGPEANAYFYVASNVSGLVAMIPVAVSLSLFAHGAQDEEFLIQHTLRSAKFALVLLVPTIASIFIMGGRLLSLFGKAYADQATQLLWILALSTLPMTVNFIFFGVRRVQQRMGGVITSSAWILGVTVALSAILLPRIGLLGAGAAWFTAQTSTAIVVLGRYMLSKR